MLKKCKGAGLIKGCDKLLEIENFYKCKKGHYKNQCKKCISEYHKKKQTIIKKWWLWKSKNILEEENNNLKIALNNLINTNKLLAEENIMLNKLKNIRIKWN